MKLIVGLGNPGKKYEHTRHNAGFAAIEAVRRKLGAPEWGLSKKFNAEITELGSRRSKTILAKPMTYMNRSGEAVQLITHFYKIKPDDVIVLHDDIDILIGTSKTQKERGDAGHNGVRSVAEHLGSNAFTRVRIGIASENPKKMKDAVKFVLNTFGILERKLIKTAIDRAAEEIETIVRDP